MTKLLRGDQITELLNRYQLRIAREEAEKVLAEREPDPKGWMRNEMATVILSLLDMVTAETIKPQSTPPVVTSNPKPEPLPRLPRINQPYHPTDWTAAVTNAVNDIADRLEALEKEVQK